MAKESNSNLFSKIRLNICIEKNGDDDYEYIDYIMTTVATKMTTIIMPTTTKTMVASIK